jgi:uncharacterized membrane protein YfcA
MPWISVFLIIFLAIFTQSLTGFGLALVSMPLLTVILGIQTAAPLVALIGLVTELVLLIYFREALNLQVVWRLALASVVGVPIGVLVLQRVDESLVLAFLGLVVAGYALYALMNFRLPAVQQAGWAYGAGFLAGILGGAYNTSGPPVIIYGHCRGWSPAAFKGNLQGFFLLNTVVILISHFLAANFTPLVWQYSLVALPAAALGIVAGLGLDKRINPVTFRKIVLVALLLLGVWLILDSFL